MSDLWLSIALEDQMKKLLIAVVSAACIISTNPASAGKLHQVYWVHVPVPQGTGKVEVSLIDDPNDDIICALTGVSGHFAGGGEFGVVFKPTNKTLWTLTYGAGQPGVSFDATCWQLQ
jgi:hypothetical protein